MAGRDRSEESGERISSRLAGRSALTACACAVLLGCASTSTSPRFTATQVLSASDASQAARPNASPEYDVLVGELVALEGRTVEARAAFLRAAEKDPDSAYLQNRLASLSAQMEDLDAAVVYGQRAVALDPEDEDARMLLGRLHRIRRDVAGAESALLDETGAPISPAAALLLYQLYVERNRFEDALEIALQLVEDDPESLGGHMAVATVYQRMGRQPDADRALREALTYHPGRLVLFSRLAKLRRGSGDREGEIAIYREVLETHPHHYGTLVSLGEALAAEGELEAAIVVYEEVQANHPEDVQSIRRLASLEFSTGDPARAARRLERALASHPRRLELAYSLGQILRAQDDDAAALAAFERVTQDHSIYFEARMQIAAIFEEEGRFSEALAEIERIRSLRPSRALDFHTAGLRARADDFDGGVALLEEMLAQNPEDDEVLYQIGVLYGSAKRIDRAIHYMQLSLEVNPDNAHALNYIGYTWAERGENLDEAERMIVRALELRPQDGYIADSLGWVYYMRARPLLRTGHSVDGVAFVERARDQLYVAVELTGGDPVVSEHLGDVYILLDKRQRALEYYQEAVDLGHREDEQPRLLDKLEGLRRELNTQ